jgi:hypothetical protein
MNPKATPFTPTDKNIIIHNMPSVVENLFFDNLEKEFVKNNPWIFETNIDIFNEDKNFTIQNKNNKKIHITFN